MPSLSPDCSFQPNRRIGVMIADRNLMSAQLLAQMLGQDPRFRITVVPTTGEMISNGSRADVVVMTADLAGNLDETLRKTCSFCKHFPNVRLILLVDNPTREMVVDAFRCGASGVFSRSQPISDFLKCVDRVSQGEIWASRTEIDHLLSALRSMPVSRMIGCDDISVLSKRELEVVRQAGEGLANKEIADRLGLSEHTIKNYLFRACEKIGVSNRVELLFYLLRYEKPGLHFESRIHSSSTFDCHQAAEEGFVAAQFALGLAHISGDGAEKDSSSAYRWLMIAAGNAERILEQARELCSQLRRSMTPDEVAAAEDQISRRCEANNVMQASQLLKDKNWTQVAS